MAQWVLHDQRVNSTSPTTEQVPPSPSDAASLGAAGADFASFYSATVAPLRRYLAQMLRSREDAKDIAHDAYLRTYHAMDHGPVRKPKAFLFTVARRLAINYKIRRADRQVPTDTLLMDAHSGSQPDAAEILMACQDESLLEDAILALPELHRQIIVLRQSGLSHKEVADELSISQSTVSNYLSIAYRLMKDHVEAATANTANVRR